MSHGRWRTYAGENTPELDEFIKLARTGESWCAIAAIYYPHKSAKSADKMCGNLFKAYATTDDIEVRRAALANRSFNKGPRRPGIHGSTKRPEPALTRETRSPWEGMGDCFA